MGTMKEFDGPLESARDLAHGSRGWEFLVGTAISVYQNAGGGGSRNNWSEFENGRTRFGLPTIEARVMPFHACNCTPAFLLTLARVRHVAVALPALHFSRRAASGCSVSQPAGCPISW